MSSSEIHLLASSNIGSVPYDASRSVAPLRTILEFVKQQGRTLGAVTIVSGDLDDDRAFARDAHEHLPRGISYCWRVIASPAPEVLAEELFRAAEDARGRNRELWVDLTAGPKSRTAVLFAAASAIPVARIVYAERVDGRFEVRFLPRLEAMNPWLGRHCVQVRDYRAELQYYFGRQMQIGDSTSPALEWQAIADLLVTTNTNERVGLGPHSNLLQFAEWIARKGTPHLYGAKPRAGHIRMDEVDADIRGIKNSEAKAAAGRAAQALYKLRCLFGHPSSEERSSRDALLLLDLLSFLGQRIALAHGSTVASATNVDPPYYIAVDGDDVGRRFEERLANCVDSSSVESLTTWSFQIQSDLAVLMHSLSENWNATFIARTGDGFLASVPARSLCEVQSQFRPRLLDATVTTGVGPSVKAAYLALKLGKAKNRGGGFYFSLNPSEERVLW